MSGFTVSSILEKMKLADKDFRYMAISDLVNELQKETFKMDVDSEKKLVKRILELVTKDTAAEVRALAVKCLPPLVKKVHENQALDMFETLARSLFEEKDESARDISGSGLKIMVDEFPEEQINVMRNVIKQLTPRLLQAISSKDSPNDVVMVSLDLINDLLGKYGKEFVAEAEKIQKAVLPQIISKHSGTKKKAIACIGLVSTISGEKQFNELMEHLLSGIKGSKKADLIRTYIQCIGTLSRTVGGRMGKYLDKVVPLILNYVDHKDFAEDDELREICFQTFESLIYRCPKEISTFLKDIIPVALKFIKYDPNYAVGSDEEDAMEVDEEEDEDEEEDDVYSDDDDSSWKVRKSSSRCLAAVIRTRPEMLVELYSTVAPTLVARFSEREENVKLDVFTSFNALLHQTALLSGAGTASKLEELVPKIVTALSKQLKNKKTKPPTRIGIYGVLRNLIQALPGCLSSYIGDVVAGLQFSFADKNTSSPLKIETLTFLRALLSTHDAQVFYPHFSTISAPIYKAVADSYYKITAEALRACYELVKVLRPDVNAASKFDYAAHTKPLYNVVKDKFVASDIDQEVKEEAINCIALIISRLGDVLQAETKESLKILLDRLRNEITRLTAVKALGEIAASPLKIDLSTILVDALKELTTFLRKQHRQLKQQTLNTLAIIVQNYGSNPSAQGEFEALLKELSLLITDTEMHQTYLAVKLCNAILQQAPNTSSTVSSVILPQCLSLLSSSLLQGLALDAVLQLFGTMGKHLSFDNLLESLVNISHKKSEQEMARGSYAIIAQCIATLVQSAPAAKQQSTVARFIEGVKKGKNDGDHLLSIYSLGEIGRRIDLSSNPEIKQALLSCFESSSEDIKSAASVAFGGLAVGNLEKYLPEILAEVNSQPKRQYLLLGSLREVIVSQSRTEQGLSVIVKFFDQFTKLLLAHTSSEEEGTRNMVSECLGKLALVKPEIIIPQLKEKTQDSSPNTRVTVVSALKFAMLEREQPKLDQLLATEFTHFLALLKDSNVQVRHATLLTLNYAIHHKPHLVRDLLPEYLPVLYGETKVKPELITEVELGPFKHKVDNGLPLRQAAFECMYSLLDTCFDRIDIPTFMQHVKDGLSDQPDIRTLNHLMCSKLAQRAPASLVHTLDLIVEPLRSTITTKVKENAVQHERDRNEELIRSALRAVVAISRIPNVEENQKFADFMRTTIHQAGIKEKFESVAKEL